MKLKTFGFHRVPAVAFGILCLCAAGLGQVRGGDQPAVSQRTFASPSQATNELIQAAQAHDRKAFREIFGPEAAHFLTGDQTLDEKHFEQFAQGISEGCATAREGAGKVILEIGPDKWPFPIPLIETNGAWFFDTASGEQEIIDRNIGHDEFHAIGVCRAYVQAQRDYARLFSAPSGAPIYAQRLRSTPGKTDGLYWPPDAGSQPSPFSALVGEACAEGYHWKGNQAPHPFHGYFFKILTRQGPAAPGGETNYVHHGEMTGGFALVAYPVRWGESGIMTFIVNQDGIVYQQSLGEKTLRLAAALKEYNPDPQWTVVPEPGITNLTGDEPADDLRQ